MSRERRNINDLTDAEVDLLEKAYKGIMARDETDDLSQPIDESKPQNISYFRLAGFHGFITYHCYHGLPSFFHWHRKYVYLFEQALRSVEGCENVTLPYFDSTAKSVDIPEWVWSRETFARYKVPEKYRSIDPNFNPSEHYLDFRLLCGDEQVAYNGDGYTTRDTRENVIQAIQSRPSVFFKRVNYDLLKYADFHSVFEGIHNNGHNYIGGNVGNLSGTMTSVPVAGFDPIFWFHHSNVERWLWIWETKHNLNSSKDYENPNIFPSGRDRDEWLNGLFQDYFEVQNGLTDVLRQHGFDYQGFTGSVKEVLDNPQIYRVPYVTPESTTPSGFLRAFSLGAVEHGPISVTPQYSILVKNINRSKITGSFFVILTVNGKDYENYIFQIGPSCVNCDKNPLLTSLFIVDEHPVDISLRAVDKQGKPLDIGSPKLNVRLPLHAGENGNIIHA